MWTPHFSASLCASLFHTLLYFFPSVSRSLSTSFPSTLKNLTLFPSFLTSQEHISLSLSLPSLSLPSCFYLSTRVASLLHIQLPLCSHPHPPIHPHLSPPRQFPAPRYRQSLLSSANTLSVLSGKQTKKSQTVRAAVGMLLGKSSDSEGTEPSLVYIAIACLLGW